MWRKGEVINRTNWFRDEKNKIYFFPLFTMTDRRQGMGREKKENPQKEIKNLILLSFFFYEMSSMAPSGLITFSRRDEEEGKKINKYLIQSDREGLYSFTASIRAYNAFNNARR